MDISEYRLRGKEMVDYIADYLENIRERRVFPDVSPGFMQGLVPENPPEEGEDWDTIFGDVERVIMPGMTHWQSPYMHAYFPALNSCPSLLGDMLADGIGCLGFTWASSPACTELETIVMDWLGKMLGLPSAFLHCTEGSKGGGVIQTTASDATFVSLLAARSDALKRYRNIYPELHDAEINARLVAYCSDQAHSSVEKAGLIGLVKLRLLPTDDDLSLRADAFREALEQDRDDGLIPFFLCATLGTTGACAFDNLKELGPVCEEEEVWLHVDAAYAGTALVCPEFRHFAEGVEYAHSLAFNPSKWMMVHFDCTAMWVKDSRALHRTFNVQPLYLKHENTGAAIDYMHWQVPLSRRFRALKLWFVIRSFGVKGLQNHVRKGVELAKRFEGFVAGDERFEMPAKRFLGMVVFRLKGENILTEVLLKRLNQSGKLHMVPASIKGKYIIRFTVTSQYTTLDDIERDWSIIRSTAHNLLVEEGQLEEEEDLGIEADAMPCPKISGPITIGSPGQTKNLSATGRMRRKGLKAKDFGMSLILSNVPMSPKFINGSFAALFDTNDIIVEFARDLGRNSVDFNGRPIRLSPRKKLREQNKQYSFDMCLRVQPKLAHQNFKQASLDSKIEEIFDTSFDSEHDDQESSEELFHSQKKVSEAFETKRQTDAQSDGSKFFNGDDETIVCHNCGSVIKGQ